MRAQSVKSYNKTEHHHKLPNHLQYTSFIKPSKNPINCHSSKVCACKPGLKERKLVLSLLTTSVFKAVDCVWKKPHTTQKTSSLLFMYFLVIPHADCYWIRLPNVSEKRGTNNTVNGTYWILWQCFRKHLGGKKIINHNIKNLTHTVMARESKSSAGKMYIVLQWKCLMEELTGIQTALKAWFWEEALMGTNPNLFRQQHEQAVGWPSTTALQAAQTCSAPCPSPAWPRGGQCPWHPSSAWAQGEQGQRPQQRTELGVPRGCSSKIQECRHTLQELSSTQGPCQAKPLHSCSHPGPGRLTDPQQCMFGTYITHHSHDKQPTPGFSSPPAPAHTWTVSVSSQHSHGHAWQNLDLCSLPWGNLDTVGWLTFAFFVWSFVLQRQLLCELVFVFKTFRGQFQNTQDKSVIANSELLWLFQAEGNEFVTMA